MKAFSAFLISALFSFEAYSQSKDAAGYLLLGLLNDYNGRTNYKSINDQVAQFYPFEKPVAEFIDSLLSAENIAHQIETKDGHFYLKSEKMALFVNSFYTFHTDSSYILTNPETDKWELVFTGRIKEPEIINSDFAKGFIIGNYIRRGEKQGDFYVFDFVNSLSVSTFFVKLIKQLGCKNVKVESTFSIPSHTKVQFTPTLEVTNWMNSYDYLRKRTAESFSIFKSAN